MKILVVSDSHGDVDAVMGAVAVTAPDMILHLGDFDSDCDRVRANFPDIPLYAVRGNCDMTSREEIIRDVFVGKVHIYMCHGHTYNVKFGLSSLVNGGMTNRADIVLFGHTHIPYYEVIDGMHVINPGSIGYARKSYGVIEIRGGEISYDERTYRA